MMKRQQKKVVVYQHWDEVERVVRVVFMKRRLSHNNHTMVYQNAIVQAARIGIALEGATLYCKMTPCYVCAKLIITAGIVRVVAEKDYHASARTKEIFKEAGVELEVLGGLEVY